MTGETMTGVKPALTAEQWANVIADGPEAVSGTIESAAWHPNRDAFAEVIALGNFALPDGHPLKLMGEDIQLLGAAAFAFRELSAYAETDHSRGVRLEYEQHVLALSRKLAALLQPEA